MSRLLPPAVLLALALLGLPAPAWGGEEPAAGPGIAWLEDWEAARQQAVETDRLRFVYVGRKEPPCPPCRRLEAEVFSRPEAEVLGRRYIAVRVITGADADASARAVAARFGVTMVPTLIALAPDGGVLARRFPRDLEGILAVMREAEAAEVAFRAKARALATGESADDLRALAVLHARRSNWTAARRLYEALVARAGEVIDQEALLLVLDALGDGKARAALLRDMIAAHPGDLDRFPWRIDLAMLEAEGLEAQREALRALLAEFEPPRAQAAVRSRLADVLHELRDVDGALAQWNWIVAHTPKGPWASRALLRAARTTLDRAYGRGDLAGVRAGRALLQRLLDEHGSTDEAAEARRMRARADRVITQLEAKAAKDAPKDDGGR